MKQHAHFRRVFAFSLITGLAWVAVACRSLTARPPAITPRPTVPLTTTAPIVGLGILGDSNSDEYRADDNRGGQYAAVTLSWVELIAKLRGVNLGAWGNWGEPRRTGYEYNWSRSSATVHDAIESGQLAGSAEQVASGKVSHVVIWIGTNDFAIWNGTYQEIYDGRLSGEALQAKIDGIASDITQAVDMITHAGPVKVMLVTIADRGVNPDVASQFSDAAGRRRVSDAIRATNDRLIALANSHGIVVVDSNVLAQALIQHMDKTGVYHIGNEQINVFAKGNEPHNGELDDETGHPGTILSGVIANEMFIRPVDEHFGAGIPPLSDEEILQSAGLFTSK